jgi:L-lactate utilization protein LutB
MDGRVERTLENLRQHGFEARYFETAAEAKEDIVKRIEAGVSVGCGGSVTLAEMGLLEALEAKGCDVIRHGGATPEERVANDRKAALADFYLSSSNAITETGSLVNIDGSGNRLAGMLFGHKQLLIVAGVNKITGSLDEAYLRIKNVAAPPNCKRLGRKTPCAELGRCMNCNSPDRICNATLIIDRQPYAVPTAIYLINEKLGY